jgi:hypothetical protein
VSASVSHHAGTLVVEPRWGRHAAFLLLMLVAVAGLVAVRRSDLDADDDFYAGVVLALCFWVFAIGLGSFVRNVRAGHALRLDAEGLHVPGLDVVPWHSVARAELRGYGDDGKRFRQLVIHTDALRGASSLRRYERYVFGPWAGLVGSKDKVVVPVGLLAVDPDSLLTATREFVGAAGPLR